MPRGPHQASWPAADRTLTRPTRHAGQAPRPRAGRAGAARSRAMRWSPSRIRTYRRAPLGLRVQPDPAVAERVVVRLAALRHWCSHRRSARRSDDWPNPVRGGPSPPRHGTPRWHCPGAGRCGLSQDRRVRPYPAGLRAAARSWKIKACDEARWENAVFYLPNAIPIIRASRLDQLLVA